MTIHLHEENNTRIAEIVSDELLVNVPQDALDLLVDVYYQDVDRMVLHEKNITPEFFDLKTKLAGEILQKFSNYRMRLSIIGDFSKYPGSSLRDFIFESNKQGQVSFVPSLEEAKQKLAASA